MKQIWERVRTFEPALLRAVVVALVYVAGIWGLDAADLGDRVVETWAAVYPLFALLQGWWTRQSVTPNARVDALQEALVALEEQNSQMVYDIARARGVTTATVRNQYPLDPSGYQHEEETP